MHAPTTKDTRHVWGICISVQWINGDTRVVWCLCVCACGCLCGWMFVLERTRTCWGQDGSSNAVVERTMRVVSVCCIWVLWYVVLFVLCGYCRCLAAIKYQFGLLHVIIVKQAIPCCRPEAIPQPTYSKMWAKTKVAWEIPLTFIH